MSQEKQPAAAAAVEEPAELDWRTGKRTAYERYAYQLETGIGADVYFEVGKPGEVQELIPAHKSVLFNASRVFERQFSFGNSIVIPVQDVHPDTFRAMLKVFYADDFSGVNKQNVLEVYNAGKKYLIVYLVDHCRQSLIDGTHLDGDNVVSVLEHALQHDDEALIDHCHQSLIDGHNLNVSNVISVLKHAQYYEDKELIECCWSFVDKNAKAILGSEKFLALNKRDLCELFSRETFESDELFSFRSLHRWAINKCEAAGVEPTPENKRTMAGDAIYQIRFPRMRMACTREIVSTGLLDKEDMLELYGVHFNGSSSSKEAMRQYPNRFNGQRRKHADLRKCRTPQSGRVAKNEHKA